MLAAYLQYVLGVVHCDHGLWRGRDDDDWRPRGPLPRRPSARRRLRARRRTVGVRHAARHARHLGLLPRRAQRRRPDRLVPRSLPVLKDILEG